MGNKKEKVVFFMGSKIKFQEVDFSVVLSRASRISFYYFQFKSGNEYK